MSESVIDLIAGFNGSTMSSTMALICFIALPVGVVLGWTWDTWRARNIRDREEK